MAPLTTSFDQTTTATVKDTERFSCALGINYSYAEAKKMARSTMKLRLEIIVDGKERKRLVLDHATLPNSTDTAVLYYDIAAGEW